MRFKSGNIILSAHNYEYLIINTHEKKYLLYDLRLSGAVYNIDIYYVDRYFKGTALFKKIK